MIQDWIARKAGVAPLADRIAALERGLAESRAETAPLADRAAALEQALADTRAEAAPLSARIAALERELADKRTMIALLSDRLGGVERTAATAVSRADEAGRLVKTLTRAMRAGGTRLREAVVANLAGERRSEALDAKVARLKAALAIVEARVDDEAEQGRRSVRGLFDRIETIRARDVPIAQTDRALS